MNSNKHCVNINIWQLSGMVTHFYCELPDVAEGLFNLDGLVP